MNDFLVALNQSVQRAGRVRHPHGAGRADARRRRSNCGRGSCRDSAWLLVQLCRHLGLAARFVLRLPDPARRRREAARRPGRPDRPTSPTCTPGPKSTCPGPGWVGLDPTSGLLAAEGHIPLACTADPQTAAPVTGSFAWTKTDERGRQGRGGVRLRACGRRGSTKTPRVTKPYTDEQWAAIDALGQRVDADLREWDVRLTMGGEPTFVSIDDRDAAEWNTAALGPNEAAAGRWCCSKRLRDRFAPAALLHFGQGKWYPGEPLPRWAFGCYWRRTASRSGHDPRSSPTRRGPTASAPTTPSGSSTPWPARSASTRSTPMPGYEDAWYYLWRERRLPANVDPLDSQLDDAEERARLAKVFEQGLGSVGRATPCRCGEAFGPGSQWESGPVVPPAGAPVPGPRRLADGLPAAARLAAVGAPATAAVHRRARPVRRRGPLPPPTGGPTDRADAAGLDVGR